MKGYISGLYPVRVDSTITALSTAPGALYRRVKLSSTQSSDPSKPPLVTLAGANEECFGTLISVDPYGDVNGNWQVSLLSQPGSTSFIASGAITAPAMVYPDASGKVTATGKGRAIGVAMNSTTGDGSEVEVLKSNGGKIIVTRNLNASSVSEYVYIADRPCVVTAVNAIDAVVSSSGTLAIRKITAAGTDLPGGTAGTTCKELLASTLDLTTTAGTVFAGTLTSTAADLILAAGDKIAIKPAGTLTGLVGTVSIELQALSNQ